MLTMELGISPESFFAKDIQIYCTCCIEIYHGLSNADGFYVVVRKLQPFLAKTIIIKWKRLSGAKTILAASTLMHEKHMRLRQDQDGLWLLRESTTSGSSIKIDGRRTPKTMSTSMFSKVISIAKNPYVTLSSLSDHLAPT